MSSLTKKQKENGLIAIAIIFLLGISAYAYFMVYSPAKEARMMAEQTFKSEREVLMALQEQVKALPEEERVSTADLQQRVSVEPLSELIVLQLEQAEVFAGLLPDTPVDRTVLLLFRVGAPPVEDVVVIPHHQGWYPRQQC